MLVVQTSATSVIVEWSQPSGGATVTGYVVHYSHGDGNMTESTTMTDSNITNSNMTESVPASSTHALIKNLLNCYNYTFSVEVTSEHLSGISKTFISKLGKELHELTKT